METIVVTAAGQLVAASVFLVLTALVFVLAPRATIAGGVDARSLVGAMFGLFGPLFGFPDWMVNLSPLAVGAEGDDGRRRPATACGGSSLVVVVGAAASITLMRRRELATGG